MTPLVNVKVEVPVFFKNKNPPLPVNPAEGVIIDVLPVIYITVFVPISHIPPPLNPAFVLVKELEVRVRVEVVDISP